MRSWKIVDLARARRPDQRDPLARPDGEGQVLHRRRLRRAGIGEGHALEGDRATRRLGHRRRPRGRDDQRRDGEQFGDPSRRPGRRRHLAPHLRQFPERGRGQHCEQDELGQEPAAHLARQHVMRAKPQHEDDAAEGERHGDRDQERPCRRRAARGLVGALDRPPEPRRAPLFGAEGLHGADRPEALGREGGGVGQLILRVARALAHDPARGDQRRSDNRNGDQHQRRELRAGIDHERHGPQEHHKVAQRDRDGRAEGGLDLGRVGGQPRDELAGPRLIVEGRVKLREMGEDVAPQVGDHPLAERRDEIVAGGGGERDDQHQRPDREEIGVDRPPARPREAEVDHPPEREGHGQRRAGGREQCEERRQRPAAIVQSVTGERQEGAEGAAAGGRLGHARPYRPSRPTAPPLPFSLGEKGAGEARRMRAARRLKTLIRPFGPPSPRGRRGAPLRAPRFSSWSRRCPTSRCPGLPWRWFPLVGRAGD